MTDVAAVDYSDTPELEELPRHYEVSQPSTTALEKPLASDAEEEVDYNDMPALMDADGEEVDYNGMPVFVDSDDNE